MPTAITSGHQALPPDVPTPHVSLSATPSHERSELPPAAAQHTNIPTYQLTTWYGLHYYQTRLKTLGLTTASAKDYGLDVDAQGNILQLVRHFDGSFVEFIPRQFRQKVDSLLAHRSNYQPHLVMFSRILAVTRYHPDYLKVNPGRPKYGNQYGESVRPLPAPRAIKAYNNRTTGGLITFIEGYFKAIALDLAGIESVAFTGITVYRITPDLREYLLRRRPDRIFIMYDADALEISGSAPSTFSAPASPPNTASHNSSQSDSPPITPDKGPAQQEQSPGTQPTPPQSDLPPITPDNARAQQEHSPGPLSPGKQKPPSAQNTKLPTYQKSAALSSRRNQDFNRSATTFSNQLFTLFDSINHHCEIVFVMGKPAPQSEAGKQQQGANVVAERSRSTGAKEVGRAVHPKGIDDLIAQHGAEAVINDLTTFDFTPSFRHSQFFAGFTLAKSSNHRKLKKLFLQKDFREWAEVHAAGNYNRLAEGFIYRSAHYQTAAHGDLYDESLTYHLLTDPFQVDIPTDYLTVKNYLDDQKITLSNLLQKHQRLAIQAPTGSGKTSFFTYLARKTKIRMVIAVPTVNLADQIARKAKGYALTGNRNIAKIQKANDSLLVVCTYDTLHQVPDLWRRILVFDEAHNLVNQYGQVYNGFKPFRAETLRNCVRLFDEARQTVLLSGTMSPILCRALDFHLVTVRRLVNPAIRVFDIEASGATNTALAKSLLTRLIQLFPLRAERATGCGSTNAVSIHVSPLQRGTSDLDLRRKTRSERGRGRGPRAQRANNSSSLKAKRLTSNSSDAASVQFTSGKLHVVFWNNTHQINRLKTTLIKLGHLKTEEIAIISRAHYDSGDAPELDDIISRQKIKPGIKLLLCTCLISEGVNINNTNVGRIFTVGLRCEDTFRQFIARFRKLKSVNVFSILEAEKDLSPYFFPSAEVELRENMERAQLQAKHLRQRQDKWLDDYDEHELPFLDQIEQAQKKYSYRPQLLNLVYREEDWHADPLHVLAAIRGRKLATSNNCYFYSRLRDLGFNVLTVEPTDPDPNIEAAIDNQNADDKAATKTFRTSLKENLQDDPAEAINALDLWYQETKNRHGRQTLRNLCTDLLDEEDGASGIHYLTKNRAHFDEYTRRRILRRAKLHALGVDNVAPYLAMSDTDFNHAYRAALAHFERMLYDDPEHRKLMQPAHKEEIRIKQRIVAHLTPPPPDAGGPLGADAGAGTGTSKQGNQPNETSNATGQPLSGKDLVSKLLPLLSVPRATPPNQATYPNPHEIPPKADTKCTKLPLAAAQHTNLPKYQLCLLGLTPTKAINLVRQLLHTTVTGSGIHRTITIGEAYSPTNPPPLAALSRNLRKSPLRLLEIMDFQA